MSAGLWLCVALGEGLGESPKLKSLSPPLGIEAKGRPQALHARGGAHAEGRTAAAAAVGRVAHGRAVGPRAERAEVQQVAAGEVEAERVHGWIGG